MRVTHLVLALAAVCATSLAQANDPHCENGYVTYGGQDHCLTDDSVIQAYRDRILRGIDLKSNDKDAVENQIYVANKKAATEAFQDEQGPWHEALAELPSAVRTSIMIESGKISGCDSMPREMLALCSEAGLDKFRSALDAALVDPKGCDSAPKDLRGSCVEAVNEKCGSSASADCRAQLRSDLDNAARLIHKAGDSELLVGEGHHWCINAWTMPASVCGQAYQDAMRSVKLDDPMDAPYSHKYKATKANGGGASTVAKSDKKKKAVAKSSTPPPPPPATSAPAQPPTPPPASTTQVTPSPPQVKQGSSSPNATPSLREPSDSAKSTILDNCRLAWMDVPEYERKLPMWQVCDRLQNSDLAIFDKEIAYLLSNTSVDTYIELLRMEALSRFLKANRDATGTDITPDMLEKGCPLFADGINKFGQTPKSKEPPLLAQPDYLKTIGQRAVEASDMIKTLKQMEEMHHHHETCSGMAFEIKHCIRMGEPASDYCRDQINSPRPKSIAEFEAAVRKGDWVSACITQDDVLDRMRDLTPKLLEDFPGLAAGRDATKGTLDQVPETMAKLAAASKSGDPEQLKAAGAFTMKAMTDDLAKAASRFCNPTAHDSEWRALVNLPNITDAVLRDFPVFKDLQNCAVWQNNEDEKTKSFAKFAAMIGCGIASIGPQAAVTAPACAVLLVGASYLEYRKAKKDVSWVAACTSSHSTDEKWKATVCDSKDYEAARDRYESAVDDLALNGVFAGLEVVGAAAKGISAVNKLRRAATELKPAELEKLTVALASAKSPEQVEAIAQDVENLGTERTLGTETGRTGSVDTAISDGKAARSDSIQARYSKHLEGFEAGDRTAAAQEIATLEDAGYSEKEINSLIEKSQKGCSI